MKQQLAVFLILILGHTSWAQEKTAALVCDVKGEAQHRASKAKDWSKTAIFDQLGGQASLLLPKGSSVQLSFVEGGRQATLQGPCRVELRGQSVHLLEGSSENLSLKQAAEQKGRLAPVGLNIDRMGGLVRPKASTEPRWTTDAVVLAGRATLSWQAPLEYKRFRVELSNEIGEISFAQTTDKPEITMDSLLPGQVYSVKFCAWKNADEEPDFEWNGDLETLSQERSETLRSSSPQSIADKSILLSHYYANELYQPALKLCGSLLKIRPNDANLKTMNQHLRGIREVRGL